jgi:beta-lactamase class A/beta-lactamase class A CARB-5
MWPPERAPLVAAVYITETKASMEARNAAIAALGKVIAQAVDQKTQP